MNMLPVDLPGTEPYTFALHTTIIAVLLSFLLSSVIAVTYELTTKSLYRNAHFLQALALISIVAFTIVHAVGDSLARGLGILGALMFIRFRTAFSDPRNTVFLFASLAAGISCGALKFHMAVVGTFAFCVGAFLFRYSRYNTDSQLVGHLKYRTPEGALQKYDIEPILRKYCSDFELNQQRYLSSATEDVSDASDAYASDTDTIEPGANHSGAEPETSKTCSQECHYLVRLKAETTSYDLTERLMAMDGLESVSLNFKRESTRL